MLNAGALYYYAKPQARLNPFVGVSAFNLLTPNESFFGQTSKLPFRMYAHVGTRINITETFYVIPKVLIMSQKKYFEQTYAAEVGYYLKGSDVYLLGGLIVRAKDAMIATLGAKFDRYLVKIAYDFNISSLTRTSSGKGGFEISFTYTHKKNIKAETKICPRL